ncbi:MAG: DUF721 domain-containing protein [Deltaproteobacteria bacterium]|nr:DUF721 domain-containing protein [Deltaproteobacteria bacterium]
MGSRKTRERLKNPIDIKSVLRSSFKNLGIEGRINEVGIIGVWDKVVGHSISRSTMPAKIVGKTLYVAVADSVWMEELKYHKKDIINNVNKHLERDIISDVIFRIGYIDKPLHIKQQVKITKPCLTYEEKKAIEELTAPLKNEELKNIISGIIAKQKGSLNK